MPMRRRGVHFGEPIKVVLSPYGIQAAIDSLWNSDNELPSLDGPLLLQGPAGWPGISPDCWIGRRQGNGERN